MGRRLRPNLPGRAFHLTARVQGHAHRFTAPLRDRIVERLALQIGRSDVRLLAYAVMTNHLHLVIIQGAQPLSRFMQPLLRSVALAVNQADGTEGHVFERPFRDVVCRDDAHLCNAIAYTHDNPLRAGLCAAPGDYRWSSHSLYVGSGHPLRFAPAVDVARGLEAFTAGVWRGTRRGKAAYAEFFEGASARFTSNENGGGRDPVDISLELDCGGRRQERVSLDDIAGRILNSVDGAIPLSSVRTRWGPRSRLIPRNRIVLEAVRAGFSGKEIAQFLDISEPTVSQILRSTSRPGSP